MTTLGWFLIMSGSFLMIWHLESQDHPNAGAARTLHSRLPVWSILTVSFMSIGFGILFLFDGSWYFRLSFACLIYAWWFHLMVSTREMLKSKEIFRIYADIKSSQPADIPERFVLLLVVERYFERRGKSSFDFGKRFIFAMDVPSLDIVGLVHMIRNYEMGVFEIAVEKREVSYFEAIHKRQWKVIKAFTDVFGRQEEANARQIFLTYKSMSELHPHADSKALIKNTIVDYAQSAAIRPDTLVPWIDQLIENHPWRMKFECSIENVARFVLLYEGGYYHGLLFRIRRNRGWRKRLSDHVFDVTFFGYREVFKDAV